VEKKQDEPRRASDPPATDRPKHKAQLGEWVPGVVIARKSNWIPTPGEMFAGTYRLTRTLGEGAMGVVFLARDVRLERDVAIKLIHPDYVSSPESHQRFLDEARAMARVRHPNVVEIYAFDERDGAPYFVMEYVPGMHVEQWLEKRRGQPLSVDEAVGIVDQVCRGVSAIHRAGTIHRDLKWTNVLIGPAFRIAVADLGLARILDRPRHESIGTVSGTPAYMAPEIVIGHTIPPGMHDRADVYSLAVMTYELLTGRLPFETDDATEMMTFHVERVAVPPSEIRHDLPPLLDAVIARAMEKNPARRTISADAYRRELLEARESASQATTGLRLLVADDDQAFACVVAETLAFAFPGASIATVRDGIAALEEIGDHPFDLAVIDLDMPGMNGIELTAAVTGNPLTNGMPIIVATASGGAPDWRLLQSLGAAGFLVKPIDATALVAMARGVIARARGPR
jgi:serine/threonine-protein kinase